MSRPSSPPAATQSGADELPAYVSNGLVGLRVLDIPLLPGMVMVSGFAGLHPEVEVEAAAEAPYPLAGDIRLNGVRLRDAPHLAEFIDQRYDFSSGEITTRFRFHAEGATLTAEVLTFCSRERPTLVLQEVSVEVTAAADVELRAQVDCSRIHGRMATRHTKAPGKETEAIDGSLEWESLGGRSTVGIAYATEFLGDSDAERRVAPWGIESDLATDYAFRARTGRRYRLRQLASVVPSVTHSDPDHEALRLLGPAGEAGWERLREENQARWDDLWRGRVLIDADDGRWQQLADAAFYYLNSSVHPSAPASTSIYGLAMWNDYHYYYGHVMWDVEFFGVPPLLLLQPDAARALLDYRSRSIDAARGNARLHGRKGLQFPWESGPRHGEEAAPGIGRASWHEDHVSPDVAWAFAQYAHATGDRRFLAEDAYRVLYGVADWIVSRVQRSRRGYSWREAMGIAERKQTSDNDAFTIMIARTVLGGALACAERLGHSVGPGWRDVMDGLHLRPSRSNGALMSHDGFHPSEEKGATPGPLAGIFPVWHELDPAVEQATLRYFLDLAPGYVGSPMLSPLYGVWACWAGDRRLATRLYEEGYAELIGGRFLQTLEQSPTRYPDNPKSGPFFANIGGFLMGLLYGLPGIRLGPGTPDTWPARPVVLPAGWRSIEVERAWMHGAGARIIAEHGATRAQIVPEGRGRQAARAA
jgi:trehalose/maltose hydrolase-like predicted phosphorylase